MTKLLIKVTTGIASLLASQVIAQAQEVTLRYSNWLPPTHPVITRMIEPWASDVEAATEGRVKIQILPALGTAPAHYELVRNGVADIAFGVHSYTPERFKLTEFSELPFTTEHAVVHSVAYWRTYEKFFLDENEHEGTKLLGLWGVGAYQLFANKPMDSVEDLEGLKIRIPGVLVEHVAETMGMVTISSSITEAYDQLSRGIIDGMFQNLSSVIDFNLEPHMPHQFSLPGGWGNSSQYVIMDQDAWDKISPQDQAAIEELSGEAMVRRFSSVWQEDTDAAPAKLEAAGMTRHRISGEDLETIRSNLSVVEEKWVEEATALGVDARGALTFFREEIDRLHEELGVPKE